MTAAQLEHHLLYRLKFRQLRLLVAVDHHRNILKASKELNIAQPAATKSIRELEDIMNVPLFERSSRGVTPTLYGEVAIKHAKFMLSQVKQISEEITSISQGITGHINVGTLLAASPTLIPQSVLKLKEERPNITVTIIEGTNDKLMPALRTGDIDVVVGRLPEFREREGLKQDIIYDEPISIVSRKDHPLADHKNISFSDLKEYDWILPPPSTSLRRQIESEFRNAGLEPPLQSIESISILTNFTLLAETDMIAAMPNHVVENNNDLIKLPITFDAATSAVGISYRSDYTPSTAVNYFIETLKQVANEISDI
ncbi:LysR substrate-binding domain-containing protein [Pseudemcibacter aquimaris]|uniref:LysR substrate-binding domain-containing protein n=1 Tax=Pseudemcibacter aquimaris TaxID=2857064 RepID=UPI0020122739|nr:LysR substrate-binding domain-containing protein [Pseudemcibacter aquimaris]MCC3861242.1 LysR family transcriptional regulator [Pseudemcibacter aquimaris]WDU58016.1 LysR family transcriptional regulator [Pseudemcibacter aquimaris]